MQGTGYGPDTIHQTPSGFICYPTQLLPPPSNHPGVLGSCLVPTPHGWTQEPCEQQPFPEAGHPWHPTEAGTIAPRLLITPQILADLMEQLVSNSTVMLHDRHMLQAAMSLAFFGFLHVSELTVPLLFRRTPHQFLARGDIQFIGHQFKVLHVPRRSKTDQLGKGLVITVGSSEDSCCPIKAMKHYLKNCRAPLSRPLFHVRHGPARKFQAIPLSHLVSTRLTSTHTQL